MSNEYSASNNPFGNIILAHNPIWKVVHLTDVERADKIVVFYGFQPQYHNKMDTLNELFLEDPENVAFVDPRNGQPIFNKTELQDIRAQKTEVVFVESFIHIDDSIERIKLKLVLAFAKQFSLEEMYLFARTSQSATTDSVYDSLTQKGQFLPYVWKRKSIWWIRRLGNSLLCAQTSPLLSTHFRCLLLTRCLPMERDKS